MANEPKIITSDYSLTQGVYFMKKLLRDVKSSFQGKIAILFLSFFTLFVGSFRSIASVQATEVECGTTPANIVLMLDRTGSVNDTERAAEKNAAIAFIEKLQTSSKQSKVALGRFGKDNSTFFEGEIFQPLTPVDGNVDLLKNQLNANLATRARQGNTNIKSALEVSRDALVGGDGKVLPNSYIILLSDGDANRACKNSTCTDRTDNTSESKNLAKNTAEKIKAEGINIVTIAYDASAAGKDATVNRPTLAAMATQPSHDDTKDAVDPAERDQENKDGDHFFISINPEDVSNVLGQVLSQVIVCNDNDPCTDNICNHQNKCEFPPRNVPECTNRCRQNSDCDNGNPCDGAETCDQGVCSSGTPIDCDDENRCTQDSCNTTNGKCENNVIDASCDAVPPPKDQEVNASDETQWVLEGSGSLASSLGCSLTFLPIQSLAQGVAGVGLLMFSPLFLFFVRKKKK